MKYSKRHSIRKRPIVAFCMLFVLLAYLVYLPVHTLSGEHCLPGASEAVESVKIHEGHTHETSAVSKHVHHEHSDGTTHHQHHTADQDEVESTGKIGSLKLVAAAVNEVLFELSTPVHTAVATLDRLDIFPVSFSPGHWLVSRGPPVA